MRLTAIAALLLTATAVGASDAGLTGAEGHPRARFPLSVHATPAGSAALDAVVRRAVDDWNVVARDVLGLPVFVSGAPASSVQVLITIEAATSPQQMGETQFGIDDHGVIALPVEIVVHPPAARGQTTAETLLYQVVAHELGHALGLPHTRDPRSLMCCVTGSIDFSNAAVRDAYVEARRHPDIRSVSAELRGHYDGFWRR